MFSVSLGKWLCPFCKVLRQWIWSLRESYTFLYFNKYKIGHVELWYSHKYRTFRPLEIIKILQIQFCSLLEAVVLKCQLLILFVTLKIVLSTSKNFCRVSGFLSEGFSHQSGFLFHGSQIKILVTYIARPYGNIQCHWNACVIWYYSVSYFRKGNMYW